MPHVYFFAFARLEREKENLMGPYALAFNFGWVLGLDQAEQYLLVMYEVYSYDLYSDD